MEADRILKAIHPKRSEIWSLRLMLLTSFFWMVIFIWWFFGTSRMGSPYLYWPLTIVLCLKLMRMMYEWYHYYNISIPVKPLLIKRFSVDMLTTACPGEPHHMIIRTLQKMVAVKYPHTTYLCDEGNDPALKKVCDELGVIHVTRTLKINAKAGNINNALKQATGDLCIIMDPDHEPVPEFIDRVLPYFEDPDVGYVQVVQGYYNQKESFVARAAAEQTYHYYGPMMMCMNSYGTPQAIGANCTFRRAALDSIGGHAAGLTEDMHTSMKLQAKGWKCLYVPEMLSRGLVPSTVSAFYKQQLKWGRGTFELFFEVLPGLLKDLNWRQRFHHLMAPLYYLSGILNLINIIIPVLSLCSGDFPWKVDIETFILFYSPLLLMNTLIRQYSQRWLMEESERGFHIRGGLLQLGTWWIYAVSLIYSIFRVKVPYIPTPKEGEKEDNWILVSPNLIAGFISIAAIIYGLKRDYNPYSLTMAGFAMINAVFLLYFSLKVQQRTAGRIEALFRQLFSLSSSHQFKISLWKTRHGIYAALRKSSAYLSVFMVLSFLSYTYCENPFSPEKEKVAEGKITGGFYRGIYLPENDIKINESSIIQWDKKMKSRSSIVSFYQPWGPESIQSFPDSILNVLIDHKGIVPMITWEPWSSTFPEFALDFNLATDRKVMSAIASGQLDFYLTDYCKKIKSLHGPVFLRFAHEPDNEQYPWSLAGDNSAEEFIEAHRYIVNFFSEHGVSNVAWVWNPWNDKNAEKYYPGDDFVDWIGITGLNYGTASMDGKWKAFKEIYEPFRPFVLKCRKPVMISEFGTTDYGGNRAQWLTTSLSKIADSYSEIKSLTFFYSNADKNWTTSWRPEKSNGFIDWTFNGKNEIKAVSKQLNNPVYKDYPDLNFSFDKGDDIKAQSKFITHSASGVSLNINGNPFYIKGVAYNTGGDWRDGKIPLTKNTLEEDFESIKFMGANTIRRYGIGIYDENILETAEEKNLKVIYGFWFDPEVDYYSDTLRLAEYEKEVEGKVIEFKDNTSVLVWSLGNETWGLLKHKFSQPYLTLVRNSYVKFLNNLADKIHHIDAEHPVMTAAEHSKELPAELEAYSRSASSLDFVGVNSYYIENIRELDSLVTEHYPGRTYMISEFGPKGYWNSYLSQLKKGYILEEESDRAKADYYAMQWSNYIAGYKNNNIGGVAYCWHDRLEGTATWFGITDYSGRKKASYYKLAELWNKKEYKQQPLPDIDIEWEADSIVRGKYAAFRVKMSHKSNDDFSYEWHLRKERTMEEFPGYIRTFLDGKRIFMKIPDVPGVYRLYLYVNDGKGNVSTVSHPIPVAENILSKNKIQ